MFLICYRQIKPGPWLSVPGMMVATNSASSLRIPEDVDDDAWKVGELAHEAERTRYCLRGGPQGSVEISRLDMWQRKDYVGR